MSDFDPNFPQELIINGDWPMDSAREWLAPDFEFPSDLEKTIEFQPGHALKQLRGPGSANNYGIGSIVMAFYVKGPKGATQFTVSLGWVPEMVPGRFGGKDFRRKGAMAYDLGYHATVPQWEGQEDYRRDDCELTPNGVCYYDGSGLQASALLNQFVMTGDDAVIWKTLVERYRELIGPAAIEATPELLSIEASNQGGSK